MDKKEKQKILEAIRNLCKSQNITAYQISQNTGLNTSNVHKIINGEIKNPHTRTVFTIHDYINKSQKQPRPSGEDILANAFMNKMTPYLEEILMRLKAMERELDKQKQFL